MTGSVMTETATSQARTKSIPTRALADLSLRLQRAGRETRSGNGWLSTAAVVALTVCTWLALVVVGGTMMFYRRSLDEAPLPLNPTVEDLQHQGNGEFYLQLAFFACVFVIPAMISLVSQSAVLGAAGRENRLATLRLIGLSNGAVTRMTLVETALQALLGLAFGTVLAVATAPFWALISFDNDYLGPWDMLLPWWGYPMVWGIVMVLALISAVVGLKRVLVSPLGVSRREIPKAVRRSRVLIFIGLVVVSVLVINALDLKSLDTATISYAAFSLFIAFSAVNVVAPFVVQALGRISAVLAPGAANFVATRRVAVGAKETWRRVSAMTFLSLLLGFISLMPQLDQATVFGGETMANDILVGVVITFVIGFVILLISTVLTQASAVYEQAALTKALDFIGTPVSLHRKVAFKQTFYPMLVLSAMAFFMGNFFGLVLFGSMASGSPFSSRTLVIVIAYLIAVVSAGLVTYAVDPLRRRLLGNQVRRND
nr:FtsX-like permease family protein [Corynebacterium lactis]